MSYKPEFHGHKDQGVKNNICFKCYHNMGGGQQEREWECQRCGRKTKKSCGPFPRVCLECSCEGECIFCLDRNMSEIELRRIIEKIYLKYKNIIAKLSKGKTIESKKRIYQEQIRLCRFEIKDYQDRLKYIGKDYNDKYNQSEEQLIQAMGFGG